MLAYRGLCDVVVASVYVNPTQFSANEDFDLYPREVEGDRAKLEEAGCCTVFEPRSLYRGGNGDASNVVGREGASPNAHETFVQVERLQQPLCGKSRPHFFKGVTTIVSKLFNIVEPDVAVFGRKDYQQWRVITRMVRDLDFAVEVVGMPICREADGLALSSRNARLTPEARQAALCIPRALEWAKSVYTSKPAPSPADLASRIGVIIKDAGGLVDYVEVLNAQNLQPILDITAQPALVAVAAHFPARDQGSVRLIDNCVLESNVGE
ncbi:hypothetical protein DUNSADRAFT_944 [Dunaliella salina]|uniref:Pantoate--beta-alanine ligase n=1 Tax=Dunaliella salina TaxID=3046 RepID=A0ABQ7GXT8_DUNSA|nr:hypothetical protein DUNSADRAFT_944 [Dunaliella salina]|eukprot:KAF5839373.1 hypothetical protein DUNSADRAFT_944 [Dunaliella salina]